MILADTSVWIRHFRHGDEVLVGYLNRALVWTHPFVIGELACGNLKNRARVLSDLGALPVVAAATNDEALEVIERHRLQGLGIGWIDAHLIASALLTPCSLWTLDSRLQRAAAKTRVTMAGVA